MRLARIAVVHACAALAVGAGTVEADEPPIPFVKQWQAHDGRLAIGSAAISVEGTELTNEVEILTALLADRGVPVRPDGTTIRLELADVEFPEMRSRYRDAIVRQGYHLVADSGGVRLRAPSASGVYYAIQTLVQLIADDRSMPCVDILDWPDFAVRGIMVDAARANENFAYYARVIQFCAHHKINRLHMHLTDDENASLYHEDYPTLMHPHAWRPDRLARLVTLAQRFHVDLVAEIESLGHARLFVRHPDREEFLHQTTDLKPKRSWAGTDLPGLTNVLCPASEHTYEYLEKMFARVAEIFPATEVHIGCDEVDMTECARCRAKFGDISHADWFLEHLLRCRTLLARHGRSAGIWGDMLLHHREMVDRVPTAGTIIYDWHYQPGMSDESVAFFTAKGFEVLGCPALVCHPHMIMPSDFNYGNIRRFAEVARAHDLLGLNTTVWTPTRYMSDVLWPGLAFAAVHAWGGSNWDESAFHTAFARNFFGSPAGEEFGRVWSQLAAIRWWLDDFKLSCWTDEEGLTAAAQAATQEKGATAQQHRQRLREILQAFARIDATVTKNRLAWDAMMRSAHILDYTLEHFLAAADLRRGDEWNIDLLGKLDARCVEALAWIEEDWDRNRFADDPYKRDLNRTGQHLLDRFHRMHLYHRELLSDVTTRPE